MSVRIPTMQDYVDLDGGFCKDIWPLQLDPPIVEAHKGQAGVEDIRPHGARFWFTLPLV